MENKEKKRIALAVKRLGQTQLSKAFDAAFPNSRPHKKQTEILSDISKIQYRYVVAGNQSGKSQLAARDLTWFLNSEHPYFERPSTWGIESLTVIVAVQDLNLGSEMWSKKIKPFLKDDWKEERQGQVLKKCINRTNGDTIYFLSHSDGSEKNRKHMQGYVANYLWLDEMPSSHKILEELQRRVDAREGRFIATFTPKFKNDTIRRMVDAAREPVSKKYQMSKLDNPIYADRIASELQKLDGLSEAEKRTILFGEWSTGEYAVYHFDYDQMVVPGLPDHYNAGWRHVESVDPAMKSKFGYTMWAEDPATGVWYLINDKYIEGLLSPDDLVIEVKKRSHGYNVIRRISDPHEGWFIGQAAKDGLTYLSPYDKNNRKHDLIKGLQKALSDGRIKIGGWCSTFLDEIQSCQWSETTDRMINSSSFHTMDCAQYFVDMIPKVQPEHFIKPWHVELRESHQSQKKAKHQADKMAANNKGRVRATKPIAGWGRKRFRSV